MTPHFGFTDQRVGRRGSSFLLAEREESAEDSATSLKLFAFGLLACWASRGERNQCI